MCPRSPSTDRPTQGSSGHPAPCRCTCGPIFPALPARKRPAATPEGTIRASSRSPRTGSTRSYCARSARDTDPKSGSSKPHRNPPRPEGFPERFEASRDRPAALLAPALSGDAVVEDAVPIPGDHGIAAVRAVGAAPFGIVHVACIHIAQAVPQRYLAGARQRRGRRGRYVRHLVVGMKSGEMKGHIGAELLRDPAALGVDLGVRVVLAGD